MSPSTRSSASITRSGTKREGAPLSSSHKPSSRKRALSKAEQEEVKSKKGKQNDSGVFQIILSYLFIHIVLSRWVRYPGTI